ncbi:MAG: flavin reductase family protein [Pigmentiphaga sp.]|uniref:flavin reductase family protein n=1 Tax=Pigmentiphaga sp. TaxID=1977564 RepID=UPI0029BC262C|nr:flavin reductase family protein [Pigmentiphaga sp.]MDX3904640.1 flavin reductase family protein [Pigmentiphaga sp.]
MRRLAAGVTIITAGHEGERMGLTATAVCSLTATPPRLLACVNLHGATYRLICAGRQMAVNVLADRHEPVAREFSRAGRCSQHMFDQQVWDMADGVPVMRDALAVFLCSVEQMLVMDTHAVVIGSVQRVALAATQPPLLYADGHYGSLSASTQSPPQER